MMVSIQSRRRRSLEVGSANAAAGWLHYGRDTAARDTGSDKLAGVADSPGAARPSSAEPRRQSAGLGESHDGDSYRMAAAGPHTWDCSSFTQAAYAHIGVTMPRTATAQRRWLAAGNGTRIQPGHENPAT